MPAGRFDGFEREDLFLIPFENMGSDFVLAKLAYCFALLHLLRREFKLHSLSGGGPVRF
jgi:hypothetical protein